MAKKPVHKKTQSEKLDEQLLRLHADFGKQSIEREKIDSELVRCEKLRGRATKNMQKIHGDILVVKSQKAKIDNKKVSDE